MLECTVIGVTMPVGFVLVLSVVTPGRVPPVEVVVAVGTVLCISVMVIAWRLRDRRREAIGTTERAGTRVVVVTAMVFLIGASLSVAAARMARHQVVRDGGRSLERASTTPVNEVEISDISPISITTIGVLLSAIAAVSHWSLWHRRAKELGRSQRMTADLTSAKEHAEQMTRLLRDQSNAVEIERERLELALSGTGIGSWDWNPLTGQAQFDDRWAAIVGEACVRPHIDEWSSRVHPDDLAGARRAMEDHFAGTTSVYEFEHRVRHREGAWRWVVDRGIVVSRDNEGRATRIVGTREDITMRKLSEQNLARERSRLATFIEHAPAAVAMFDNEMRYIAVSNRWKADFKLGGAEVLGISYYDVFPELPVRWKEAHARCLAGAVERCEDDPWRPPGWHYDQHLRWEVRPWYEPDGQVGGLVMFTQDISDQVRVMRELERRGAQLAESEKRFRTLVEGTEVIVWEYDAERSAFTYVSPQASRLGYPLEEWLTPKFWETHLHEADRSAALAFCRSEIEAKRHHRFQYRMIASDGRVVWIDDFASVEESARCTPLLRGVLVDITERKTVEETMHQARVAADAANHAKSEFLANMSHEIRTPLTAILGYADLLRDDGDMSRAPARRVQTIDTIRNAGHHLLTIINDILDISKIEAGQMTLERVETPIVRIMTEVESLVRARANEKGIALSLRLITPLPDRISSDPTRLRQILMNLAGNAVKFTSTGHVTIRAKAEGPNENGRLIIEVEDTGTGMSAEQAERLFKPFSQADSTVTRQHGGTGLGLSISRRLARLMDGEVSLVHTKQGEGSCFRIELPLVALPGAVMVSGLDVVSTQSAAPLAGPVSSLRGRIVLAEDGPDNQRLISYHLKRAGAVVDIAENGAIALEMIRRADAAGTRYDLLVSDMQMPEMDGYTLARTLRAEGNAIAIVALTAHAMAEDHAKCLGAGCDAYATKPIDKSSLLEICARWIGKRTRADQRRAA